MASREKSIVALAALVNLQQENAGNVIESDLIPELYTENSVKIFDMDTSECDKKMQNSRIENFYMSQVNMQLNISNKRRADLKEASVSLNNFLNYIFPRNTSAYMPAEGVRLRIIPYEVVDARKTVCEVLLDAWQHFRSQFLQQYYSQILGLQVLVNGYASQTIPNNEHSLSESDKMACTLLSGYRCLLGQINMSTAALEQCVNEMFTNQSLDNIQRIIKRIGLYHYTSNLPSSISMFSKSFTTGAILALDQLITKSSHNGMLYDGEVFFRGTGKALLSLVMRHPDEKSDDVQIAIEAIRRAAILGEPIQIHQRLTRYNNYLGLKPLSLYDSMGNYLLETVAGGKFLDSTYWSHAAIDNIGKSIILVSLQHLIRVNKYRLWGPWELEWSLDLDDIISVPRLESNVLKLNVRQAEENKFVNADGNLSISGDKETLTWLQEKIEQAIIISMEDKSWSIMN